MNKLKPIIIFLVIIFGVANLATSYLVSHCGQEISQKEIKVNQLNTVNQELENQVVHQSTLEQIALKTKKLGLENRLNLISLPAPDSLALSH